MKIIGVLWLEYTVAMFVTLMLIVGIVRLLRGISGNDAPEDLGVQSV